MEASVIWIDCRELVVFCHFRPRLEPMIRENFGLCIIAAMPERLELPHEFLDFLRRQIMQQRRNVGLLAVA